MSNWKLPFKVANAFRVSNYKPVGGESKGSRNRPSDGAEHGEAGRVPVV